MAPSRYLNRVNQQFITWNLSKEKFLVCKKAPNTSQSSMLILAMQENQVRSDGLSQVMLARLY